MCNRPSRAAIYRVSLLLLQLLVALIDRVGSTIEDILLIYFFTHARIMLVSSIY